MSKKLFSLLLTGMMLFSLVACGKESTVTTATEESKVEKEVEAVVDEELLSGIYAVCIEVQDYGAIFVELDADAAPITVTNFMKLVNEGFYDGLTFHRIMEGFMMQGGDPTGTGRGGADTTIKGEFEANGVPNPIKHERGTISMARSQMPDSASSQFFICQVDCDFLDGSYAAFGHVVSGIEVVDAICEAAIVEDNNGTVAPTNQPVITSITDVTAEYRADALGETGFIPNNPLEEAVGKDIFDSYDEVISLLTSGMGYAYVDVKGSDEPVLLINTEGTYDNGDGNMAALEAFPYLMMSDGTVRCGSVFYSSGTAYPISVLDGVIYCGGNHNVDGLCVTSEFDEPSIMMMFSLYEEFDENANATYGGFIRTDNVVTNNDGKQVAADDSKPLEDAYAAYGKAKVINFTVIE